MKYKILIEKIHPPEKETEGFYERPMRIRQEETIFEAFVNEEEVIEFMRVGYFLKEKAEREATKSKNEQPKRN